MNKTFRKLFLEPTTAVFHSNVYGLARTILATGTILTLLFNDTSILFTEAVGFFPPSCNGISELSLFCILSDNLEVARWVSIFTLSAVAIGWRPRITGLLHWWIVFSLNSTALLVDGGDQVANALVLLLLPICLTDGRKWHWESTVAEQTVTPVSDVLSFFGYTAYFFIRLQVAFIYFSAAVEKLKVEEWTNGSALYYWLLSPYMGASGILRSLLEPVVKSPILAPMATWSVLLFELCLFLAVTMPVKQREWLLFWGILFHFGIAIVHGLFPFFLSMTAALILYLRPPKKEFDLQWIKFLYLQFRTNRLRKSV